MRIKTSKADTLHVFVWYIVATLKGNEKFASLSEALSVQEFVARMEGHLLSGGYSVLLKVYYPVRI